MWKVKALVSAFNQEKTLVGAFSVIVQLRQIIVCSTTEGQDDDDGAQDRDDEVRPAGGTERTLRWNWQ